MRFLWRNYGWIAPPQTEVTSGAWRKNLPPVSNGLCLAHQEQGFDSGSVGGVELSSPGAEVCNSNHKNQNKSKRKRKIKEIWGFGGEWKPAASPLNLQLGSGPVHFVLIATGKKTRHKLFFFKKHQDFSPKNTFTSHTIILLVSPTSSFVILSFDTDNWTDIWTFLSSTHRDPLNFLLSLSSPFSSFISFLLAHFLWVGSTNTLLISDSLAYQILCCLCSGWRPCYGNFAVPSARNELSFFGDLDAGSS